VPTRARILFVTADMGAGHREVTGELVRRCSEQGATCDTVDIVRDGGSSGARLRRTYRRLLDHAPWLYDGAMRAWARWPAPLEAITALNGAVFDRLLRTAADRFEPDLIVSTYNLASQCLGRVTRRGHLTAPVATFVTDAGAHPYWVSRHIAAHFVPTDLTGRRLAQMGASGIRVVEPALRPEFDMPPTRADARARLSLPADQRIILLTAGSWAVGGIADTLALLRGLPDVVTVVLCGRDETLHARLAEAPDVTAVGWTPHMVQYLAAADVVVDNAGGLTCWESLACRTPVVLYRPLVGHGRVNVATLDELGLAKWARSAQDLVDSVAADRLPPGVLPSGARADHLILELAATGR
jgi:UDP-N-acetylglucosamine:LPS N-acetylglucosamine transferase